MGKSTHKIKITIIGAGQAGLLLGISLLRSNYDVTLITDQSEQEVFEGRILSNQAMFDTALEIERWHGLNFWEEECPKNYAITMCIASSDFKKKILNWSGNVKKFYHSVDQRIKFSRWLREFEGQGGKVILKKITLDKLNEIAARSNLTIIASGNNELSQIFPHDEIRSEFHQPQRVLSCLYVKNMIPTPDTEGVRVNLIPGVGEYLVMTGLTKNGPCKMMQFEGIPGKAFDSWDYTISAQEYLQHAVELLNQYIPWEAKLCQDLKLADEQAILFGKFIPAIRKPIAKLSCGKFVLGLGDAVVLLDPLAGQGANNATKAADIYYKKIIHHSSEIFNDEWMLDTFETYWNGCAKWATDWTSILLKPPAPHIVDYLTAASTNSLLANKLAEGFNEPKLLFPWINDPLLTREIIKITQQTSKQNELKHEFDL